MAASTIPSEVPRFNPVRPRGKPPRATPRHPSEIDAGVRLILYSKDLRIVLVRDITENRGQE
jgi:hypothetical protein